MYLCTCACKHSDKYINLHKLSFLKAKFSGATSVNGPCNLIYLAAITDRMLINEELGGMWVESIQCLR
jgi:hypothetical protein